MMEHGRPGSWPNLSAASATVSPRRTAPILISDRSLPVQQPNARDEETQTLRDRLTRLSEASLRVSESLDLDTVLPEVLDSARSLTGASYGVITALDESGQVEEFLASGLTAQETQGLWDISGGLKFFEYLSSLPGPLRGGDFAGHARAMGLPEFRPPVPVSSFLTAPIRHRGRGVGTIYLGKSRPGEEFSQEDEETLVMFAAQAALVIANARRHREEHRAKADLETLVNTSPVGVVVFDARTGAPLYVNRESRRMLEDLRAPGGELEDLLGVLTFRRADGREVSLREFPMALLL
ncbi:MAG: GAF domain-containing protein, partial [Chloroflexi bacterium]|nr:GAF domain-containing protein [Chloroflexota bacterium]